MSCGSYPKATDVTLRLVKLLMQEKRVDEVRRILDIAVRLTPEATRLLELYAELLADHFDGRLALRYYNRLIALRPNDATYLAWRANIYVKLSLYDLAMRDYRKANDLADGKAAWIIANIANLLGNLGFYRDAIGFFNQVLSLRPNAKYAHERLAIAIGNRDEEVKKLKTIETEAGVELARYSAALSDKKNNPS